MNKAFVREPEFDGRAYCPRCGSLGAPVAKAPLDRLVKESARARMGHAAWFCSFPSCEAAYFDLFESVVTVEELHGAIYPKDPDAPICACFGFTIDQIEADLRDGAPTRIRALLARSKSSDARCSSLAADGKCCIAEVQRIYMQHLTDQEE